MNSLMARWSNIQRARFILLGPFCNAEKRSGVTRYGVIGTREGIERFNRFSARMRGYIPIPVPGPRTTRSNRNTFLFPVFKGFDSEWPEKACVAVIQDIQLQELRKRFTYKTGMKPFIRAWIC